MTKLQSIVKMGSQTWGADEKQFIADGGLEYGSPEHKAMVEEIYTIADFS